MTEQPPRRRGAPKGNQNARKFGFYSRRLPIDTALEIENTSFPGLHNEIKLIRALIGDLMDHATEADTLQQRMDLLRVVTHASVALSRLLGVSGSIDKEEERETLDNAIDKAFALLTSQDKSPASFQADPGSIYPPLRPN